jgi:hypothetical protein
MFTGVAALSLVYPASVQANIIYTYEGPTFLLVTGPYTTSDFVTATLELAQPLPPDFSGFVQPSSWRVGDGVQLLVKGFGEFGNFFFVTNADGDITAWSFGVFNGGHPNDFHIDSLGLGFLTVDVGVVRTGFGIYIGPPGPLGWSSVEVPDAGSTLSLMTPTLMALGLLARRFQRAAA